MAGKPTPEKRPSIGKRKPAAKGKEATPGKKKTPDSGTCGPKGAGPHPTDVPVVGIGASAGGLEALQQFFKHLPADRSNLPPMKDRRDCNQDLGKQDG